MLKKPTKRRMAIAALRVRIKRRLRVAGHAVHPCIGTRDLIALAMSARQPPAENTK